MRKARMHEISYILFRAAVQIWNVVYDLRFGALLRGDLATRYADLGAYDTTNTPYLALSLLFRGEKITADDVLVDVGCGKGRVINWWLNKGISNAIIGLELDPEVAARTRDRLQRYPNVTIISGDAVENLPAAGTLFLVANPFDREVVERFKERVLELQRPDRTRIFYYNSESVDIFESDPRFIVVPRKIIPERCTAMTRRFLERFLEPTVVIRLTSNEEARASRQGKP
ncbi:MAG: methyltransferase domain-containing protein [Xanthobacteraceae bacterium]